MGKTNPTQREALDDILDELDRLERGLRRRDQQMLADLLDEARGYYDALHHANPRDPWVTLLLGICLAQQRVLVDAGIVDSETEGDRRL